jgi:hypothetical protein
MATSAPFPNASTLHLRAPRASGICLFGEDAKVNLRLFGQWREEGFSDHLDFLGKTN